MNSAIKFDKTVLGDPPEAMRHEWLETNGLGGYASSTIIGGNTRKYHGLLVSPAPGTDQRYVFLSRIEATLYPDTGEYPLSTNQYPGLLHPTGFQHATEFNIDGSPHLRYDLDGTILDYRIMMRNEQPAVLLCHKVSKAKGRTLLKITPLLAFRDFNATASANDSARLETKRSRGVISITPYEGLAVLFFQGTEKLSFTESPDWFRNTEYIREQERGYDFTEDVFTPGIFTVELKQEEEFVLQVSVGKPAETAAAAFKNEIDRRKKLSAKHEALAINADQFLITKKRAGKASVIAGFPWFGEWGRDAMISLPGLTLSRNEPEIALETLESYASFEKDGLFPNQLNVYGGSSYNTVDASLWFFWAAQMYAEFSGNADALKEKILPAMRKILTAYITDQVPFGSVREDGLLDVGSPDTQLTWMDAKVHGKPVTPRYGRPVEINALWINALRFYAELSDDPYSYELAPLEKYHDSLSEAFLQSFWLEDYGYLADVVYPDGVTDASIRPNQIFAVSLPHSALSDNQAARVVETVEKHLLTPYGLRTLTPNHVNYAGKYGGSQESRDSAYHQGTVWPWLIGHFVDAFLRIHSGDLTRVAALRDRIIPAFDTHLYNTGLGSVSEVFDGDEPHTPGGCPMQAWSVAEVLRASMRLNELLL
ncbi:MAG: glycogen debranching protein [Spirochaetales bacterium]|nr:glycogen debranching protein [Spirochaetales bacterium]